MYIYEGHMSGSLYASEEYLDYKDRYCEQCGDGDDFVGCANTKGEAWSLLMPMTEGDYCVWDKDYIVGFINNIFDK